MLDYSIFRRFFKLISKRLTVAVSSVQNRKLKRGEPKPHSPLFRLHGRIKDKRFLPLRQEEHFPFLQFSAGVPTPAAREYARDG